MAIHARHLELVFEIGYRAQPADNNFAVLLAHEILEQPCKALDLYVWIVAEHFLGDVYAFLYRKERFLGAAVRHTDNDAVKETGGASNQIFMPTGERIECSGINSSDHCAFVSSGKCWTVN